MKNGCERSWELDALREGRLGSKDALAFERHLHGCAICTHEKAFAEKARDLGAQISSHEPSELEMRRLRVRVLRSAELGDVITNRPTKIAWSLAMVAALLTCVAFSVVAHRSLHEPSPPVAAITIPAPAVASSALVGEELAGTVQPSGDAKWRQTRIENVERVTLEDGALRIHVRHQLAGERFFVDTPDGVIEVRGTTFEVEVFEGHTTRVAVDEGFVAWKFARENELILHAGDSWKPPVLVSARPSARPSIAPSATMTTAAPDDGSQAYASAVLLLNDGDFSRAASALGDYLAKYPSGRDREDASYLYAVALARAGRTDEAATAAQAHLDAYPQSFHRKEALLLVARGSHANP